MRDARRARRRPSTRGWVLALAAAAGCRPAAPDDAARRAEPAPDAASTAAQASPAPAPAAPPPATEPAPAAPPSDAEEVLGALASRSTSRGTCTEGQLEGGLALPLRAPGLAFSPTKDPGSRFGTVELVQGLVRAAAAVEREHPGVPVTVGDLAREAGGPIGGHASHRSGRDVDVLFYLRRSDDTPFVPSKAIPLDPEGRGTDYGDLADPSDDVPVTLDTPRTRSFVAALVVDEAAAVQRIFVVEHLRSLLLEQAQRVGAPAEVIQRFAEVTCQPSFPHDDHMHVRVFCSPQDAAAGCVDGPPMYPWRKRVLDEAGVDPTVAGRDDEPPPQAKPKPRPKLKTVAQARAEAGPMHADVVAFLDRREAWVKRPHPGRRWCR